LIRSSARKKRREEKEGERGGGKGEERERRDSTVCASWPTPSCRESHKKRQDAITLQAFGLISLRLNSTQLVNQSEGERREWIEELKMRRRDEFL
jgi:hypothetical protein